jgi:hypothetical protein
VIQGGATIIKFKVLSDNHQVVTLDTEGVVALWDIVTMKKLGVFGEVDFEEQVKAVSEIRYVPKWCAVDSKLGSLSVHLEGSSAYSAWVYGPTIEGVVCRRDEKVNLGATVVQALFRNFQDAITVAAVPAADAATVASPEELLELVHGANVRQDLSHDRFTVPMHTPVMLTRSSDPPVSLARFTVGSAAAEHKDAVLSEKPEWVHDLLFTAGNRCKPDAEKLIFHLEPVRERDVRCLGFLIRDVLPARSGRMLFVDSTPAGLKLTRVLPTAACLCRGKCTCLTVVAFLYAVTTAEGSQPTPGPKRFAVDLSSVLYHPQSDPTRD